MYINLTSLGIYTWVFKCVKRKEGFCSETRMQAFVNGISIINLNWLYICIYILYVTQSLPVAFFHISSFHDQISYI